MLSSEIRDDARLARALGHRAIGVVYRPQFEQFGNYVPSLIPDRYDAFAFIDQTRALHPLAIHPEAHGTPELYPWGE